MAHLSRIESKKKYQNKKIEPRKEIRTTRPVRKPFHIVCPDCKGVRYTRNGFECWTCEGTGEVIE